MPRRPRLHIADYPHHIVQRGHNRASCFFADEDYQAYLHWLEEGLQKTGVRLHAYVLMTNHVHLLLTPKAADDIPRLIIALGRQFVQYINKTYRRTGTLWDSRYKSSLIQTGTYLLRCQRYIELNPVRADMVRDPGEYAQGSMIGVASGPTGWARAIRCSRPIPCIWSWETRLSPGRRPIGNCFALAWTKLHSRGCAWPSSSPSPSAASGSCSRSNR